MVKTTEAAESEPAAAAVLALVDAAVDIGAAGVPGWSEAEQRLAATAALTRPHRKATVGDARLLAERIRGGEDPLGDALCVARGRAGRRARGQTFTPVPIIDSMTSWAASVARDGIGRVVDPGSGSARFLIAAGRKWPGASLVGVETDPVAAVIGRASLAAAGLADRSRVVLGDYRSVRLPDAPGPTAFLGNPPYVRHHQIAPHWKEWLRSAAGGLGLPASGLSGLHVHFFLATALHAAPGDLGALITAAEWADVNYGSLVRALLLGPLGGQSLHLVPPTVPVFADAAATSVIACFRPGTTPRSLRVRQIAALADLGELDGGRRVPAADLRAAPRWSPVLRGQDAAGVRDGGRPTRALRMRGPARLGPDLVELGELCTVHRGQVTGCNAVWVAASGTGHALIPGRFLLPSVTRARELFQSGAALSAGSSLRRVIDLPADLSELTAEERAGVTIFLGRARASAGFDSYIARHRRPWWRVRLADPPPILTTYMARRPPTFVRNLAGARYLNIAHGIYPREPLEPAVLDTLASYLRGSVTPGQGRVYAGGLVKFEPGEVQRLPVPTLTLLRAATAQIQP